MSADMQEMLGLYALGALDQDEREQVEHLLERSPAARAELADHYAVVEELGTMASTVAPEQVWHGVRKRLSHPDRSSSPPQDSPSTELARRRTGWMVAVAAAALAVVLGSALLVQTRRIADLNGSLAAQSREVDALTTEIATRDVQIGALNDTITVQAQQADQLNAVLNERDARIDEMQTALASDPLVRAAQQASDNPTTTQIGLAEPETGTPQMTVVIERDGRGYITHSQLTPLDPERTYQLWAIMQDGRVVSAAVLGPQPGVESFVVDLENLAALAVTEEVKGGVVSSQNDALLVGEVDA